MESEAEPEAMSTPTLSLFSSIPSIQSPIHPGMTTPPIQASGSVPFRWEEEPGKPRTRAILSDIAPRSLHLPPRLFAMDYNSKTPSPTTVLEGPYDSSSSSSSNRNNFSSSSFRFLSEAQRKIEHKGRRGFFGHLVQRKLKFKSRSCRKEVGDQSFAFSTSMEVSDGKRTNKKQMSSRTFQRNESFSSLSQVRSHFWAAMYHGFKQLIPWRSKKSKTGALIM